MDFSSLSTLPRTLLYHSRTLYLFTKSDLKTIVIPSTLFATTYTLSLLLSSSASTTTALTPSSLLLSLLLTILWIYTNLLPFTIDNQRQPESILEDAANKPWRPIPSKRISPEAAAGLTAFSYGVAIMLSLALGASIECGALIVLGSWYNNLKDGLFARNVLNGFGYVCFTSGALEVMTNSLGFSVWPKALTWSLVIGLVVASSIHMLDLADQVGDKLRDRRTIPLVFGDGVARWTVALAVAFWSIACPSFWRLNFWGFAMPIVLGAGVVKKMLLERTREADRRTGKLYNLWIAGLFCLPLLENF